ncbi:MAG: LLM class flavin-dependent oxidoreductase [Candidatus Bathyarchaeia archaeon]
MKFGYVIVGSNPTSAVEQGLLAEKSGFHRVWVPDHFVDVNGDKLEPWTILSAIAVKTKKVKLGSGVTDTQRSHPARTAHAVACLDFLSSGRAVLGIGAGEAMNITPFGLPWDSPADRVARLAEAIQVIQALWKSTRENPTSFNGRFYKLENAFMSQLPTQRPHPPIYIGAIASKRALQVVGQLGDGWYGLLNTPETFKKGWSIVKEAAESAGRSAAQIEPSSHLMMAFPRNSAEKKAALLGGKAMLLMEKKVLATFGYSPQIEHYQRLMVLEADVKKVMTAAEEIPDDIAYRTMAIGGKEEVESKIEELAKAGVKHFAVADFLAPASTKRTLKLFRGIIKKYVRAF